MNARLSNTYSRTIAGLLLCLFGGGVAAKPYPEGTHVMVMTAELATREQLLASSGEEGILGQLLAEGVDPDSITDGSVAIGIIYCCGGSITRKTAVVFYLAPPMTTALGDVVEISVGYVPDKKERKRGELGKLNRAVAVRDNIDADAGACRWDPPNDALWMRVLYCDWMLGEGWERRGGLNPGWYKEFAP